MIRAQVLCGRVAFLLSTDHAVGTCSSTRHSREAMQVLSYFYALEQQGQSNPPGLREREKPV